MAGTVILAPSAHTFAYTYQGSDPVYRAIAAKLDRLPGPVIVSDGYANLPWVQRDSPHFVIASNYDYDRAAGQWFEDGGWQGLVSHGYFGTVVVFEDETPPPDLLKNYTPVDKLAYGNEVYVFYCRNGLVRNQSAAKNSPG